MALFKEAINETLQKIKISPRRVINFFREQRQEIANYIEEQNAISKYMETIVHEDADERKRNRMCRDSVAICLASMHDHCIKYLQQHPEASYEEWIENYHPDNVSSIGSIDHRFYVRDSDHRIIWNSYCDMNGFPERKIQYSFADENDDDNMQCCR